MLRDGFINVRFYPAKMSLYVLQMCEHSAEIRTAMC